jgi:hypothetical protein
MARRKANLALLSSAAFAAMPGAPAWAAAALRPEWAKRCTHANGTWQGLVRSADLE